MLANEVEFISNAKYEESVWMKVCSEWERETLYIGCGYMPTDSTSISAVDSCYERYLVLGTRERLFCWVISMPRLVYMCTHR